MENPNHNSKVKKMSPEEWEQAWQNNWKVIQIDYELPSNGKKGKS